MMNIGYACLTVGVSDSNFKTLRKNSITEEKLNEIIKHNLNSLSNIIDYNIKNNIKLFRITSSLIPFGITETNNIDWPLIYKKEFEIIGKKIKENNIRVTMHPGQYTVLNSPRDKVVLNSIEDLDYHALILDLLETDHTSKIVLHVGGVYGDKELAIGRFVKNFDKLNTNVQKRLVIENDDRSYNIKDVLDLSNKIHVPAIFDNLHHKLNSPEEFKTDAQWIDLCNLTFKECDGRQKVHYSEQDENKQKGAHSETINHRTFLNWSKSLNNKNIDVMLEVKDKNKSTLKIINTIIENLKITPLEKEWAKYKYLVLEYSPSDYYKIREFLKNKQNINTLLFYDLIDNALKSQLKKENQINALNHVWGYFKDSDDQVKKTYSSKLNRFKNDTLSIDNIKKFLYKLAEDKNEIYLLESYYFYY